jgi:hypothetical protein
MNGPPWDPRSDSELAGAELRLLEQVRCGMLDVERIALAAHLGDRAAARVLGTTSPAHPASFDELGGWLTVVVQDAAVCRRFMLALARTLLVPWSAAHHLHQDVETPERIVRTLEQALSGQPSPEEVWASEEGRLVELSDVAGGTTFKGLRLYDLVDAFMVPVSSMLYGDEGSVSVRRDQARFMIERAQTGAGVPDLASGPFVEACELMAKWAVEPPIR